MSRLSNLFAKREPSVGADRVALSMMSQWSPLEILSPRMLAHILDSLKGGELAQYARLWDDVRQRDDLLSSVEPKRRKDVARLSHEIVLREDTPAAARQKDAVERFFATLRYEDVMDEDKSGGVAALIRGMMLAVGFGWSVQEIVWRPSAQGLSATLRQVPLWFFERRKGRLRFLEAEGAYEGRDLEPGGWLVTACDDKLAIASLVLYLFKHMPLRDWLVYCHRYVVPGLHGKTPSKKGSSEWNDLRGSLLNFGQDWAMLTGKDVEVETIDASAKGELPYPPLVDRCDRRLSGLWRGADLSTMSAQDNTGASLQGAETDALKADDAVMVEDVLNARLVPLVLRYTFGDVEPLVDFQLQRTNAQTKQDLEIYDRFHRWGVPVAVSDIRSRFGVATPGEDEETLFNEPAAPAAATVNAAASGSPRRARELAALANALGPVRAAIASALEAPDADLPAALADLQRRMPELFDQVDADTGFPDALSELLAQSFSKGLSDNPSRTQPA